MAHKSAISAVMANQIPVVPTCKKDTCIKQPPYFRSKRTIATSSELLKFRSCVAEKMSGESGTQAEIRAAFRKAAKACK